VTLQEQLDDARKQLHLLLTGQAARVFVDQNGERVEYVTARAADLQKHIQRLEAAVEVRPASAGPMRVFF
jgi:hypothetical protein